MEQTPKQKILLSLPFWWIALTVLYIGMGFLRVPFALTGLVGLFVPIGVLSLYYLLSSFSDASFYALILVLIVPFYGEYLLRKFDIVGQKKIVLMLCALLLLTLGVDFLLYHTWQSLGLWFANGFGVKTPYLNILLT